MSARHPDLATALTGALLLLSAATFDAEPLYVPGLALLTLAAAAQAWVALGTRGLSITRTVGARTVVEDQPVEIAIRVRAWLVLPGCLIDEPLLDAPAQLAAGRRDRVVRITARFARRGRRTLAAPRVLLGDPLRLAHRSVVAADAAEVLVLPRIDPVTAPGGAGDGRAIGLQRGRPWVAAEVDLDGVRPHRPGAPASRIIWPVLARTGELHERRLRADTDTRPLIVLDPRGAAISEDLDDAVRAAASLVVHLARLGGCAVLLPGDRRPVGVQPTLAGFDRIHVRLALVGGDVPLALGGVGTRRGPIVYVSARRSPNPPRVLALAPGGGRLLVVPGCAATLGGHPAAFRVGGCTGYELTAARRRAVA